MEHEALVTGRGLALGARQRVFLLRDGMQEHGEVFTDRTEALLHHLLGRGADHHVVMILHRQSQQGVAHGAADNVNLHPYSGISASCFGAISVSASASSTQRATAGCASTRRQ